MRNRIIQQNRCKTGPRLSQARRKKQAENENLLLRLAEEVGRRQLFSVPCDPHRDTIAFWMERDLFEARHGSKAPLDRRRQRPVVLCITRDRTVLGLLEPRSQPLEIRDPDRLVRLVLFSLLQTRLSNTRSHG